MFKGFNNWLMQMKDDHKKEELVYTKPEPERKIIFEISEPVQSIIRSLEEGWWDAEYSYDKWCVTPTFTFKHEWFGTVMTLDVFDFSTNWCLCNQNWMAPHEKHHVQKACKAAYEVLIKRQDKRSKEVQREGFMNLVNFDVVK